MNLLRHGIDSFVPDEKPLLDALSRCTDLCIAAHQDDLEIIAYSAISRCYHSADDWFIGVVVTDGSGSIREAQHQKLSTAEYSALRRSEQREAARIGQYGAIIQLNLPSASVKQFNEMLQHDLVEILQLTQPNTVYLHSPADRHETHIGVFLRCLEALRAFPTKAIPQRLYGCEVWGSLDWLPAERRIPLNSGDSPDLAKQLLTVFSSQIAGGKRYDLATLGRRQANATFSDPYAPDSYLGTTWAMDLLPLLREPSLSVKDFLQEIVIEFSSELQTRVDRFSK